MTILIKGMNMPESCHECDLKDVALDYELSYICPFCGEVSPAGRAHDCPLVEVPTPHGRLADADALKERIAATYYSQDEKDKAPMDDIPWMNGCNTKVKEVCGMIDDAPTVIEAED